MTRAILLTGPEPAAPAKDDDVSRSSGLHTGVATTTAHARLLDVSLILMAVACWLLTRHYNGVQGDARIYVGRALADLSPTTVGRDLMFVHDGQSMFSLFPALMRLLVQHLGAPITAAAVAFLGIALWFVALSALALRMAPRRTAWAMVMFTALLPSTYGALSIFAFGESAAVPRLFAEASVLTALWAVMGERQALSLGLLVAAGLFHPIMALYGAGVVVLILGWEDRRWLLATSALAVLALAAAAAGFPLANRLFHRVDTQWLQPLHGRNPYLFPTLWSLQTWARAGVQFVSAVVSAMVLQGRKRLLFAAVAIVGVIGVVLALVGGDLYPSLLVIQVQPWRALWLVAVFGAAGLAVCTTALWKRGPTGHITLAMLALSWLLLPSPTALAPAALAVGVQLLPERGRLGVSPRWARLVWLVLFLCALSQGVVDAITLSPILGRIPAGMPKLDILLKAFSFQLIFAVPLIVWLLIAEPRAKPGPGIPLVAAASLIGLVAAAIFWNQAPPTAVMAGPDRDLATMIKSRPGEVQWINGETEAWALADRPTWLSELQGASIVFSRDAALAWQDRMRRTVALGLVGEHGLTPWAMPDPSVLQPAPKALAALCASSQGPSWIVSPVLKGLAPPDLPGVRLWRAPYVSYLKATNNLNFVPVDTYAVVPCVPGQSRPATAPPPQEAH